MKEILMSIVLLMAFGCSDSNKDITLDDTYRVVSNKLSLDYLGGTDIEMYHSDETPSSIEGIAVNDYIFSESEYMIVPTGNLCSVILQGKQTSSPEKVKQQFTQLEKDLDSKYGDSANKNVLNNDTTTRISWGIKRAYLGKNPLYIEIILHNDTSLSLSLWTRAPGCPAGF